MKQQTKRADVHQRVTTQIIEAIERGAATWRMPWHQIAGSVNPVNVVCANPTP